MLYCIRGIEYTHIQQQNLYMYVHNKHKTHLSYYCNIIELVHSSSLLVIDFYTYSVKYIFK